MSAAAWRPAGAEPTHVGAQFRRVEFQEVTALEFIDAAFDGGAQRLQFERVLTAPLLEDSQRVPHRLARVLVLTGLDDLLDEGVLLGCQADVPSRHRLRVLPAWSEYHLWQTLPTARPLRRRAATEVAVRLLGTTPGGGPAAPWYPLGL